MTLQIAAVFAFEAAGCSNYDAPAPDNSGGSGGASTGSGGSGGSSAGSGGSGAPTTGSGGSGGTTTGSGGSSGTTTGGGGSSGATTGSGGSSGATTTGSGGSAGASRDGGGSAGTSTGSGGSAGTSTGSGGSAGTSTGSGGAAGTSTGSGGSAGTSPDSGGGGAGGVADAGGGKDSGGPFSPLCSDVPLTSAGEVPTKGGVCTPTDTQLCYKTCGPLSIGFKSETCMGGVYVEQSTCSFPDGDYACYKIPPVISATCPTTTPQASQTCTVAECVLCNVAGNYLDSAGAAKLGYCVCPAGPDSGTRKWSCASTTAWPCPGGNGC